MTGNAYEVELTWWWSDDKVHDDEFHGEVNRSVDEKLKALKTQYAVDNDTSYGNPDVGRQLIGRNLKQLEAVRSELMKHLTPLKGLARVSASWPLELPYGD